MTTAGIPSFRARLYDWGRRTLPLAWRRRLRRNLPVERIFGIRKPSAARAGTAVRADQIVSAGGRDLVFLPVIPWSYRWQRPQQLAVALARRGNRVFYGRLRGEAGEEPATEAGVLLFSIGGVGWEDPPDRRLRGTALNRAQDSLLATAQRFGPGEAALIVQTPYWEPLALALRRRLGWKIVYDCLDDHSEFSSNRGALLREGEVRLAPEADLVVASSSPLLEKLAPLNSNSRLVLNACDYEFFGTVPDPAPAPDRLRIGYIGALEDWFDCGLVAELARRRPGWTFDLVGEACPQVAASLGGIQNVVLRGERPYGELPLLMKDFDVVAIPHILTPLTHAADPVKLYEAFAAGRAVVATPIRQLDRLAREGLVRLAGTAAEFEKDLLAAAGESPSAVARRRAFARENTWDDRARDLEAAISALFSR